MIQQRHKHKNFEAITVLQRKHYGCLAKIFCCKCIHACQDLDFSLLTSEHRKEVFHKMIKKYIRTLHQNKKLSIIMDPFFILVALLLGEESQIYSQLMNIINNQSEPIVFSKQDLEFYIPQLCTYLVFHEQLKNMQLEKLLVRACKVDIHFSLKYYFYMKSLQIVTNGQNVTKYQRVSKYNHHFRSMINNFYKNHKTEKECAKIIHQIKHPESYSSSILQSSLSLESRFEQESQDKEKIKSGFETINNSVIQLNFKNKINQEIAVLSIQDLQNFGRNQQSRVLGQKVNNNKLQSLKQTNIYQSFISKPVSFPQGLFESTINFFSDLVALSKLLIDSPNRDQDLKTSLKKVNQRLPATIYIPFTKDSYEDQNIINILCEESKVFKTKQRAPYYICFQSFHNPTCNDGISRDTKIRSISQNKKDLKKSNLFEQEQKDDQEDMRQSRIGIKINKQKKQVQNKQQKNSKVQNEKNSKLKGWSKFFSLSNIKRKILHQKNKKEQQNEGDKSQVIEEEGQNKSEVQKTEHFCNQLVNKHKEQKNKQTENYFGQSLQEQFQRIQNKSIYSCLPGYKLIHMIIKSNDDLRQESFAMQLLQQFDKIFKMEKLPVHLSPYEVLPVSHQAGIMQCVKDAITIHSLKEKGGSIKNLLNNKTKMKNFINSLVGYSIVTYFLQVKDRHNGNIMIKKDGSIFHIDYGYFMTNAPGKGVQLQKNLSFKLTNEYVQALGRTQSSNFQSFRLLFYKAFNACRKHQHRILILTKLMYSSYGKTMSCFVKGDESIQKLEERFNPPGLSNDAEISFFCQNLINSSIDNWRSRWYDKWQYYVQGIFY